jgi:hypothetical protein
MMQEEGTTKAMSEHPHYDNNDMIEVDAMTKNVKHKRKN